MPRYYFHIDNGQSFPDEDGTELANLTVAKCEAIKMAGAMICDAAGKFWDSAEWTMTATDERRLTLFTLQIVGTESPAVKNAVSSWAPSA